MGNEQKDVTTGQCFCGLVRFEIRGPLSDITICHCRECRRFHGHLGAYTFAPRKDVVVIDDKNLKWHRSLNDFTPTVKKGFCSECGSSLFSDPTDSDTIAIAAGTLDEAKGLKVRGHVWMEQAGEYYEVDDGTPKKQRKWTD